MNCTVDVDVRVPCGIDTDHLWKVLEAVARDIDGMPEGEWTVHVRLTDDAEISQLHGRYFADPTPTDVITFPYDPPIGQNGHLGDIVISVETAARNAAAYGQSTAREIAFLAIHGMLHLLGASDETDDLREEMLARQETLLGRAEAQLGLRL